MKIVYCLAGTSNSGGMERIVCSKANWLANNGYEVTILTTEQNNRPNFFPLNNTINRVDLDIIYSELNNTSILKKFFLRRKKQKVHQSKMTEFLHNHKPDIVISTFGNEVGILPKINDGSAKLVEIHFSRWYRLQLNRKGFWKLIDKILTYSDLKNASKYKKLICLTEEDKHNWKSLGKNVIVIPNFIECKAETPAKLEAKKIISVGRLSYQKGYDRLIDAWDKVNHLYPDWELNIFGDGEQHSYLQNKIDCMGLNKSIHICPPTNSIYDEYAKHSVFVLSSHYEGLPMVLLESLAYGLPIIAFDCQCGPKEIVKSGSNGFLIKDNEITQMSDAIIELIENPSRRKIMGSNSYAKADNYTKENIMNIWEHLFKKITC